MSKKGEPEQLKTELEEKYSANSRQRAYISGRWWDSLLVARSQWKSDRNWYYGCKLTMTGGGVLLPAIVSGQAATSNNPVLVGASITVSLIIAISGGVLQLTRAQDRFRLRMLEHHALESQGWRLLTSKEQDGEAFEAFEKEVEAAITHFRQEVSQFLVEITSVVRSENVPTAVPPPGPSSTGNPPTHSTSRAS